MIAEPHLCLDLVSIGHSDIIHLVAETEDPHVLRVGPSGSHPLPDGNMT